ncbi:MAG: mercuric ion binding protein [Limisphaerales bacterium]|jgi:mercuric ion binding protein
MKSILKSTFLLFATGIFISFCATGCGSAKAEEAQFVTSEIQTSANCGMCKTSIETTLTSTDGVQSCNLDLGNKKVTVKYDADIVNEDGIKKAIASSGYDADDVVCDKTAHDGLPACCQKGSVAH